MKNDQYFKLETAILDDERVMRMMAKLDGATAVGAYVMLLMYLRKTDNYEGSFTPEAIEAIAYRYHIEFDLLHYVLTAFDLFVIDSERGTFRSTYLDKVMAGLEKRRKECAEMGKNNKKAVKKRDEKTVEKRNEKTSETTDGRAVECYHSQKSKEEESREEYKKNIVDDDKKEIAAVANFFGDGVGEPAGGMQTEAHSPTSCRDGVGEPAGGTPEWELLVDEVAASESYMQGMASLSRLGPLFTDRQSDIIAHFKAHIRHYGKEKNMYSPEEVKSYLANFLQPNSRTIKSLKEKLAADSQQKSKSNIYRFETLQEGKRTYLGGIPIPDHAPPRPAITSIWYGDMNQWLG